MLERDLGATLLGGTVAAQTFKVPQGLIEKSLNYFS